MSLLRIEARGPISLTGPAVQMNSCHYFKGLKKSGTDILLDWYCRYRQEKQDMSLCGEA